MQMLLELGCVVTPDRIVAQFPRALEKQPA